MQQTAGSLLRTGWQCHTSLRAEPDKCKDPLSFLTGAEDGCHARWMECVLRGLGEFFYTCN